MCTTRRPVVRSNDTRQIAVKVINDYGDEVFMSRPNPHPCPHHCL
jgi:hypothetical protein